MPSDIPIALWFLTGEAVELDVQPRDADRIAAAIGTCDVVDFETDDGQRHRLRGDGIAGVTVPAACAPWEINIDVPHPGAVRDLGLYDQDGFAQDKPEWTRDESARKVFPVSIYTVGLVSRTPSWMWALSAALDEREIAHQVRSRPSPTQLARRTARGSVEASGWDEPMPRDGGPNAPTDMGGAVVQYNGA